MPDDDFPAALKELWSETFLLGLEGMKAGLIAFSAGAQKLVDSLEKIQAEAETKD